MFKYEDKLVELPNKGRLLVVADLHGRYDYYSEFLELWGSKNDYIVFLGDLIHSVSSNDGSIELLDDVIEKSQKYSNFIPLLGNHELTHILDKDVFKGGINQKIGFELLISKKKNYLEPYLSNYVKFFKSMPFFVTTANGLFLSHAGPSENYEDIFKIDNYSNKVLNDFLWNRYGDYNEFTIKAFLKYMGLNYMKNT